MLSPLPRRSGWAYCFAHSPQPYQPSPKTPSGRPAHCPFRGLLGVHLRYGLHTRAATVFRDTLSEGFSHFVTSMTAPVASGWSSCRVGFSPTGKRRLYTAHRHSGHWPGLALNGSVANDPTETSAASDGPVPGSGRRWLSRHCRRFTGLFSQRSYSLTQHLRISSKRGLSNDGACDHPFSPA